MNIDTNVTDSRQSVPLILTNGVKLGPEGQIENRGSWKKSPPSPNWEHQGSLWLTWIPLVSGCTWSHAGRGSGPGHRSPVSPHTTHLLTWQNSVSSQGKVNGLPASRLWHGPQTLAQLVMGKRISHDTEAEDPKFCFCSIVLWLRTTWVLLGLGKGNLNGFHFYCYFYFILDFLLRYVVYPKDKWIANEIFKNWTHSSNQHPSLETHHSPAKSPKPNTQSK